MATSIEGVLGTGLMTFIVKNIPIFSYMIWYTVLHVYTGIYRYIHVHVHTSSHIGYSIERLWTRVVKMGQYVW